MAFNAGSIEATLTLNRNPFTAGLAAARNQARSFANERYEATARIKVDQTSFNAAVKQLRDFSQQSRQALAKVNVDRLLFDKLVRDLREFGRQTYTATARVNVADSNSLLNGLINNIRRSANEADRTGTSFVSMGNSGERAFRHMDGSVRAVLLLLPALLPAAGAAVTGIIGLVGALTSAFTILGVGVGAFALVAVPTFNKINDAAMKSREEIAKMAPGIRDGALALKDLTEGWLNLAKQTETNVGFAMAAGFRAASAAIKPLAPLINEVSRVLALIGKSLESSFNSAGYRDFIAFLTTQIAPAFFSIHDIIRNLAIAVGNLTVAFAPMAQWLLRAIADGMRDFAKWTGTLANDPKFQAWVEMAKDALSKFWDMLVAVVKFVFNLATALTPLGTAIFGVLSVIFEGLSKLPPEWLNAIALGLSAIFTALLLGSGGPVALVAGVVVGIAAALGTLYSSNENVRTSIQTLWEYLTTKFAPIWDTIQENIRTKVIPVWQELIRIYQENLQPVLGRLFDLFDQKIWPVLGKIADTITGRVIPAFGSFLIAIAPFVTFLTETLGVLAIDAIEKVGEIFNYTLEEIASFFRFWAALFQGDWDAAWEEIKVSFGLKKDLINTLFGEMMTDIGTTLTEEKDILKADWDGMWSGFLTTLQEEGALIKQEWDGLLPGLTTTLQEEEVILDEEWDGFLKGLVTTLQEEGAILKAEWDGFVQGLKTTLEEEAVLLKAEWDTMISDISTTLQEEDALMDEEWYNFLVGIGTTLTEEGELIKAEWNALWPDMHTTFSEEWALITEEWNGLWPSMHQTASEEWELIKADWLGIWPSFLTTLQEEGAILKESWDLFWTDKQVTASGEQTQMQSDWDLFWQGLIITLQEEAALLQEDWNGIWPNIKQTGIEEWNNIVTEFQGIWPNIRQTLTEEGQQLSAEWDRIMRTLQGPVNWVIENVINRLIDAWNSMMGMIGGSTVGRVGLVNGGNSGGGQPASGTGRPIPRAEGGPIWGGIPNKDSVHALLMPGEFVLSKKMISGLGGMDNVMNMAYSARNQSMPRFAVGGVVGATPPTVGPGQTAVPTAVSWWSLIGPQVESMFRAIMPSSIPGIGGQVASDLMTVSARGVNNALQAAYAFLSSLTTTIWNIVSNPIGVLGEYLGAEGGAVSKGGIGSGGWYDEGGWLPPIPPFNGTGHPEAVLTHKQWDDVQNDTALLRKLDELIETVRKTAGPPVINVNTSDGKSSNNRNDQLALRLGRR